MALLQSIARRLGNDRFLKLMRFYPPYFGARISVTHVAPDLSELEVTMTLSAWNRNFVGTQFGGSLYSMCDPFFMLMLMMQLGEDYVVWDKSASIDFLRPGRGKVKARFEMPRERVEQIRAEADSQGKINPTFEVAVVDAQGEQVARVRKILSVRRKDAKRAAADNTPAAAAGDKSAAAAR
jgi:acyl-coenzyme A thioesterase PaaI-like protein